MGTGNGCFFFGFFVNGCLTVIEAALQESGGQVFGASGAAAKLGMARSTLESKIRSLKINKNRFKT
jgi:DNA-binding NtrC family response regulator